MKLNLFTKSDRYRFVTFIVYILLFPVSSVFANERIIHVIDFTGQENGSAVSWLKREGFEFELKANKLNPRFENDALVISTQDEVAGLFGLKFAQQDFVHDVKRVEIVWGVNKYPDGADWNNGINSVPIAVMFSFGTEKLSSGLPLGIKAAPYFLSPFIGKEEDQDKMYVGKLWRKGGRYFCVASGDQTGQTIITDFEVDERFKSTFNHDNTPPITAIAFQKNTRNTQGGSEAFIKKITFLSK
ncbi:hypothetical protein SAMN05216302_1002129 [Nitrosomonas aestuarii]|uniref:DUF3047 domain-containing protein n=1 Tax=Nitrosomonas aestuarii TaxID=52441 RepID=A0A1I3XXG9_9PROT|nr:hypothetical protein [Nitrosomonas aestuarii]SFK24183.1 hypothetical protein SAMN05216302_1002129 [Nitrosomonas aestuarii]